MANHFFINIISIPLVLRLPLYIFRLQRIIKLLKTFELSSLILFGRHGDDPDPDLVPIPPPPPPLREGRQVEIISTRKLPTSSPLGQARDSTKPYQI
jgi:hypothetical protein